MCAAAQVHRQSENVSARQSSRGGYQAKVCAAALWGCVQQNDCVCVCADEKASTALARLISTHVWILKEIGLLHTRLDKGGLVIKGFRDNS